MLHVFLHSFLGENTLSIFIEFVCGRLTLSWSICHLASVSTAEQVLRVLLPTYQQCVRIPTDRNPCILFNFKYFNFLK